MALKKQLKRTNMTLSSYRLQIINHKKAIGTAEFYAHRPDRNCRRQLDEQLNMFNSRALNFVDR